ncbi:MAG TPA: hypothetical protein VMD30_06240 [Tepidisphaeraceae bacterium]|nr:hypothetical protein [Tepidisphaeraceae bacterium]
MYQPRTLLACAIALAALAAFSSPAARADDHHFHMDKWHTLRVIRQVEEANDQMMDSIDDWGGPRADQVRHDHADLFQHLDQFGDDLSALKAQVKQQDDPWQTRDQVQSLMGEAADLGHFIMRSDLPRPVRQQWRNVRNGMDALAAEYHLPPISW